MSLEWIITGIILLGAMTAAGISLWIKRRKYAQQILDSSLDKSEQTELEK